MSCPYFPSHDWPALLRIRRHNFWGGEQPGVPLSWSFGVPIRREMRKMWMGRFAARYGTGRVGCLLAGDLQTNFAHSEFFSV